MGGDREVGAKDDDNDDDSNKNPFASVEADVDDELKTNLSNTLNSSCGSTLTTLDRPMYNLLDPGVESLADHSLPEDIDADVDADIVVNYPGVQVSTILGLFLASSTS